MQEKMEICQYLPCGLIKKRRAAKFESLRLTAFYQILMVDFRITWTLQIGAVGNSTYQTWRAKVSIYFYHLL